MTTPAFYSPNRSCPARERGPAGGRIALALCLMASTALAGCGLGVLGHRGDLRDRGSQPKASGLQKQILEAREESALAPKEPYWPYRLGQLYLAADSLSSAEAALQAGLERDRCYVPALSLLSKLYFDAGRHQQAVEMLESARARPGGFPGGSVPQVLLAGLAVHYDALDRPDLARAVVTGMPRPDQKSARPAMVYVTLRGDSPDSAADLASAALRDDARSAVNQNNYGITRLRAGDPAAARRAFLTAIELDPKRPGPYYNLAILEKYCVFDDEAAARWFRAYRDRASEDPDSLFGVFEKGESRALAEKGR